MTGIEISHLNGVINAILTAFYNFEDMSVANTLEIVRGYGKGDTLGLDAVPEIAIKSELHRYDSFASLITEEIVPRAGRGR